MAKPIYGQRAATLFSKSGEKLAFTHRYGKEFVQIEKLTTTPLRTKSYTNFFNKNFRQNFFEFPNNLSQTLNYIVETPVV